MAKVGRKKKYDESFPQQALELAKKGVKKSDAEIEQEVKANLLSKKNIYG
jgi:hypothetical protein